jgi:hypothetical protein
MHVLGWEDLRKTTETIEEYETEYEEEFKTEQIVE